MDKIKTFFKNLKHKVLFSSALTSLILAACFYVYSLILVHSPESVLFGLLYFMPPVFSAFVYYISAKTFERRPKTVKILSAVLNVLILWLQSLISIIVFLFIIIEHDRKNGFF